ncbi:MAG TPA: AAA family ATPase [Thermoanaerobaculia bacterium]|nr:AAA family ATPase [Thermoanaerobaculia bacterium]
MVAGPLSFHCRACNKGVERWDNTCPHCGAMRSIAAGKPGKSTLHWIGGGGKPTKLHEVSEADYERLSTGTRELDRVLGGGLVTGGCVLISGDPGIGKSTLLLQVSMDMTSADIVDVETGAKGEPLTILYVSAEETGGQIKGRAARLEGQPDSNPIKARAQAEAQKRRKLFIYNESDVEEIEKQIALLDPDVLIVDSIQTMVKKGTDGQPGSVQQVRECAIHFTGLCKQRGIGLILVAHVNKDGIVAGPKTLEHLVDAVLEFCKEGTADLRSVRASKNRFGDTNEMGLFRMTRDGLRSVENPSELLLGGGRAPKPGVSIGLVALAGSSRAYAMEFQSLLGPPLTPGGRTRSIVGVSSSRASQLMAVLQRRYGLDLARDTFINVPGDHDDVKDTALDLPLALCIASSVLNVSLPDSLIAFGEVGLAGEIRPATFMEARVKTAALMGFKMILGPPLQPFEADMLLAVAKEIAGGQGDGQKAQRERYYGVASLEDAFELLQGFDVIVASPTEVSEVKKGEERGTLLKLVPKDSEKEKDP